MTEATAHAPDLFISHAAADRDWVHGFPRPALGCRTAACSTLPCS